MAFLLIFGYRSKDKYVTIMYISTLFALLAFYLFQFGNLQTFSFKALSAEANFIRDKKSEVQQDAAEIQKIKQQMTAFLLQSKANREESEKVRQHILTLENEIVRTSKLAALPTIALFKKEFQKDKATIVSKLIFKPSKNVPLGVLTFKATVINGDSRILSFIPDVEAHAYSFDEKKDVFISPDGRNASISFSIIGTANPTLLLTVTGNTSVSISGNFMSRSETVAIK